MNASLAGFQDQFIDMMRGESSAMPALSAQPGFAIYRNTWLKACIDALEANFPAVACLVGREWFRSAAALYATGSMPSDGRMTAYGETFAEFLGTFEAARDMPYLADVARLDWLLLACDHSADAPILDAGFLMRMSAEELGSRQLHLHPSVRWHRSMFPARTIWQASRAGHAVEGELDWTGEATLFVRRVDGVHTMPVDHATCDFLQAIQAGHPLATCMDIAGRSHRAAQWDTALFHLITAGAFAAVTPLVSTKECR